MNALRKKSAETKIAGYKEAGKQWPEIKELLASDDAKYTNDEILELLPDEKNIQPGGAKDETNPAKKSTGLIEIEKWKATAKRNKQNEYVIEEGRHVFEKSGSKPILSTFVNELTANSLVNNSEWIDSSDAIVWFKQ